MAASIGSRYLLNDGKGLRFSMSTGCKENHGTQPKTQAGFVVEFMGELRAYQNRCPHLGIELDWAPGDFFDQTKKLLICSTHGARFDPATGKCISGPCVGQSLKRLKVVARDGELFYQPN